MTNADEVDAARSPRRTVTRLLLTALAVLIATGIARMGAMLATATVVGADVESSDPALRHDGLLLGVGMIAGAATGGALLAVLTRGERATLLAIVRPSGAALASFTAAGAALAIATHLAALALARPPFEPAWLDAYRTAPVALLALGLVITSVFEELYFRGLLHGAIARTRLGAPGAVVITALLFAAAHLPDDAFRFADVLASGALLGVSRHVTRSSITMMPWHVAGNLAVLALLGAQ